MVSERMATNRFPGMRAVVVLPVTALVVLAVVFACDAPSAPHEDGVALPSTPSASVAPSGTVGVQAATTFPAAPLPPTSSAGGMDSPPTATEAVPMDRQDDAPPPPPPAPAPPPPTQVDFHDPVAVSWAAVVALWTVDTTKDARARDAAVRAVPYLSQELVNESQAASGTENPSREWQELAEHQAHTVVTASLADEFGKPPDTPTEARHVWALTVTPVGADDWRGVPEQLTVFVALARSQADQPWKVTDFASE